MSGQKKPTEQLKARRLFVQDGLNSIEISRRLGVSAKTMSKWVTGNGWRGERTQHLQEQAQNKSMAGLRNHLKAYYPNLSAQIDEAIADYLIN